MKNSIILNTKQVKILQSGQTLTVSMPVRPQPRNGIRPSPFVKSGIEDLHGYEVKFPYIPGQSIYVREKWMPSPNGDKNYFGQITGNGFEYYATASDQFKEEWHNWWSAANMPKSAARLFPAVQGVKCKRIGDLDEYEAANMGATFNYSEGKQWMNFLAGEYEFGDHRDSVRSMLKLDMFNNDWIFLIELKIG